MQTQNLWMFYLANCNKGKNKLEKETIEYLEQQIDRLVCDEAEIKRYRDGIVTDITKLCAKHTKCRPLSPIWYRPTTKGSKHDDRFVLHGCDGLVTLYLLKCQPYYTVDKF